MDKVKHFLAGYALSMLGYFYLPLFLLGFVAGVVKEEWDSQHEKPFDKYDLWATWFGAGFACVTLWRVL